MIIICEKKTKILGELRLNEQVSSNLADILADYLDELSIFQARRVELAYVCPLPRTLDDTNFVLDRVNETIYI